jgi:hypothetical protein
MDTTTFERHAVAIDAFNALVGSGAGVGSPEDIGSPDNICVELRRCLN